MKQRVFIAVMTVFLAAGTLAVSANAQTVAWWKMDAWTGNTLYLNGVANSTHGIADSANAAGQGTIAGTSGDPNVADDPLFVWGPMEAAAGAAISSVAPLSSMLNHSITGNSPAGSYDFHSQIGNGGNMFFAADQYGREYVGPSVTAELFFKTTGSATGVQTLLWAVEGSAFTHLQLNTPVAGAGGIEAWGYTGSVPFASLTLTTANYAPGYTDGQWHYAAFRYDSTSKLMSLTVVNQDGSVNQTSQTLAANLIGTAGNGNIDIGRQEGEVNRFDGLISDVRLSNSAFGNSQLLAVVPEPSTAAMILMGFATLLGVFKVRVRKM